VRRLLKEIVDVQFLKFVLTGVLNTAVGYLVYALMYWLTENKPVALGVDYIFGIFFNFKTYSVLVFKSHDNSRIFRFLFVYILTFCMNYVSLWLLCDIFGINAYIGQIIALTYIPLVLYTLLKYVVFGPDNTPGSMKEISDDSI